MAIKKKSILIIEDENDERDLLNDLLKEKYTLIFAQTGQEAVDYFTENHQYIDLIMLDLNLPDFDGYKVFKRFEHICFTGIPNIVTITGYNHSTDIIRAMTENRAFDHLSKPYNTKELLSAIERGLKETFPRKEYALSQDIALNQIQLDRNFFMISKLQELRQAQESALSSTDLEPYIFVNQKVENMPHLLQTLEEDTGEKADLPWNPTVLIVEDELDLREIISEYLEKHQYIVLQAHNAAAAFSLIEKHHDIDIILLDLGLPDMPGQDIITAIKKELKGCWCIEANEHPDIIIVSSYHDKKTIVDTLKAGAQQFLTKPISPKDVLNETQRLFMNRYYLKESTTLLQLLKEQRAPYRYRFDLLNAQLKQSESDSMTLHTIYGYFGDYTCSDYPASLSIPKKTDQELKDFLYTLNTTHKRAEAKKAPITTKPLTAPPTMLPIKILIIEDETDYLEILTDSFRKRGYIVFPSTTSKEGLAILDNEEHIDCILVDYTLEGNLTGIELSKHIRKRFPHIYIVLHTAHDELTLPNIEQNILRIGHAEFITKGSLKQLLSTVQTNLHEHIGLFR